MRPLGEIALGRAFWPGPESKLSSALKGVENLAALWDFVEKDPIQRAVSVEVTGESFHLLARVLAGRMHALFPNASIALTGDWVISERPGGGGSLLPVSPGRPQEGILVLGKDRTFEEAKVGYDVLVWSGEQPKADFKVNLTSHELTLTQTEKTLFSASVDRAFHRLTAELTEKPEQLGQKIRKIGTQRRALEQLDQLIGAFQWPSGFGEGKISEYRPVNAAADLTPVEEEVVKLFLRHHLKRYFPGEVEEKDLRSPLVGLLREKLTREGMEVLRTLLTDAQDDRDFLEMARIARHL